MATFTKDDLETLRELRAYVTLRRASLDPPKRAQERGYGGFFSSQREPVRPMLPGDTIDADLAKPNAGDEWTNDVRESLRLYVESWVLPRIDRWIALATYRLDTKIEITGGHYAGRWGRVQHPSRFYPADDLHFDVLLAPGFTSEASVSYEHLKLAPNRRD